MKTDTRFCARITGWENPQANLVTITTITTTTNMAIITTLVTMITWGIPNHTDYSDVTGAIRKGQGLSDVKVIFTLCLHLLIFICSLKLWSIPITFVTQNVLIPLVDFSARVFFCSFHVSHLSNHYSGHASVALTAQVHYHTLTELTCYRLLSLHISELLMASWELQSVSVRDTRWTKNGFSLRKHINLGGNKLRSKLGMFRIMRIFFISKLAILLLCCLRLNLPAQALRSPTWINFLSEGWPLRQQLVLLLRPQCEHTEYAIGMTVIQI